MKRASIGIIYDNLLKKILIGERSKNLWGPPGGRLEENESSLECVIRELKEECDINASAIFLETFITKDNWIVDIFQIDSYTGIITNVEPEKCKGWIFKSLQETKGIFIYTIDLQF